MSGLGLVIAQTGVLTLNIWTPLKVKRLLIQDRKHKALNNKAIQCF